MFQKGVSNKEIVTGLEKTSSNHVQNDQRQF